MGMKSQFEKNIQLPNLDSVPYDRKATHYNVARRRQLIKASLYCNEILCVLIARGWFRIPLLYRNGMELRPYN